MHAVRPAGQVNRGPDEGLVQRDQRVAEPADAGLVPERFAQRLAERDRGVLDGMVRVDVGIATGPHEQLQPTVLAELGEHVVEERHAGCRIGAADAVQVKLDQDPGLRGDPLYPGGPAHAGTRRSSTAPSAARKAAISAGVPTVTRSQPGGPVSRISTPRSSSPCQTRWRSANSPNSQKLASGAAPARATPRSQGTTASRPARSAATVASSSPECASAARAAAWVSADRWYGSRTTCSASITAGSAAR